MSEQKEIDYMTYVAIQKTLHEWINSVLPIISNFPVSYCYVQKIPAGDGDSLTMAFTPSGSIDMTDWTGDFCTITFMLQYKTITRDSSEQLACIGALQYLVDVLQSYPIQLGEGRTILSFEGIQTPSVQSYDEGQETSVYGALFRLKYKQLRG